MINNTAIGIDLGTTYCCVAVYKNDMVNIIPNDQGKFTTPSYVAFTDKERLVGDAAKNQVDINPENTIFDIKRLIGRKYNDYSVKSDIKHFPFNVINCNEKIIIKVSFKNKEIQLTPEEISAIILTKLKNIAESYLGHSVNNVVITVPAHFNNSQRAATKIAGQIAGLNVIRIINEPTAAAIAYGLDKHTLSTILVFDMGGGTLDCSILTIDNGLFEVKATAGDTHLGGEDLNSILVIWCLKEFKRQNKTIDITKLIRNSKLLRRLRSACELAKKSLSITYNTTINVDSLYNGIDFKIQISRAKFEYLCDNEFKKCLIVVDKVLNDANINKNDINDIVLVGGSTRIPKIFELLKNYFNKEPKKNINPDEAVAYGAAIQAAILTTKENDSKLGSIILVDVVPLSLGIETIGGIMTKLIKRNTIIPHTSEKIFSTYSDNQPCVKINIYEGERELVKYNNLLGNFELIDLPMLSRGYPNIRVKFHIDANGILQVFALEESSGNSKNIIIKNNNNRFTKDQLHKMISDAENMNESDKKIKEKIESKNKLKNYLYNIRNTIDNEELKIKLSDAIYKEINTIIIDNIQWLEENENYLDTESTAYRLKLVELNNILYPKLMLAYKND